MSEHKTTLSAMTLSLCSLSVGMIPSNAQDNPNKSKHVWNPDHKPLIVAAKFFSMPKDENLEITVWASSPMLYNPTNMDIDHKGRIWVAEGVNYRRKANRRPEGDRIIVLEDTNGDGQADKQTVFLQDKSLGTPLGVTVFDNQVIIPQPPHLVVYTDVNRNLKFEQGIDKKEVLLTGFNAKQHDHSLHSLTAGPDGKWYFNNGNCGAVFKDKSGKNFYMNGSYRGGGGKWFVNNNLKGKKSDDGHVWTAGFTVRMNPDGSDVEIVGHGYRNSYEQSLSSFGDMYQNDNDDFDSCRNSYILEYGSAGFFTRHGKRDWRGIRRLGEPAPSAHWRQRDPGTFDVGDVYGIGSPTGNTFYENGALGDQWVGTYLACEPGQNTVFAYQPRPQGATMTMERGDFVTSNPSKNFIGGDTTRKIRNLSQATNDGILFRPSDVCVGVDGAIYVTDWFDGRVGGHGTIDPSCSGAIYRIAPKGFKSVIPKYELKTTAGQVAALLSPAVNTRYLGFVALKQGGAKSYDAVAKILDHKNPYLVARAIYLLPHLGDKGLAKTRELLAHSDRDVRIVAYRALRRIGENMLPHAAKLASDKDAGVRRDVALSLRDLDTGQTKNIFAELIKHVDPEDKNSIEAIGLGMANKADAIWSHLKGLYAKDGSEKWSRAFEKITWRAWAPSAVADLKARAHNNKLSVTQRKLAVESLAFIDSKDAVSTMAEIALADSPLKADAQYWFKRQASGIWEKHGAKNRLKEVAAYDPSKIVNTAVSVPEPPEKPAYTTDDVLKLTGDAKKGGKTIMRCVMCHQINGQGPIYGPTLKAWGTMQSRKAIVRSIVEPSADMAHGYKGWTLTLKDGKIIQGLIYEGDPLTIVSTGGFTQQVPKSRIKSRKRLGRSLMLSAEQLGMTAQDVADITAFMQQWK